MPLLDDSLTIWEIGFRWAGKKPEFPWPAIPMEVKDTFRMVVRAIDRGDLYCGTLKTETDLDLPKAYIEYIAKAIDDCVEGTRYDRKFLEAHSILRWEFAQWCDKAGVPFPEFWFPPGWTTDEPGYPKSLRQSADPKDQATAAAKVIPAAPEPAKDRRNNDAIWDEARAAAKAILAESGPMPAMQIAKRIHANRQLSASRFTVGAIRKRIADLASPEFRGRAGRPKGKKPS